MFSSQLPLGSLVELCRALRHQMEAGLTMAQAFKQQSKKGTLAVRPVATRIAAKLAKGADLKEALEEEKKYFPPLFLTLSAVAEETGLIPEVLRELEEYFELQRTLWRQFIGSMVWPAFQFVAAVLVLTLLIWLMGVIADMQGSKPLITIFGLSGASGAAAFFFGAIGFVVSIFAAYYFLKYVLQSGETVDRFILSLPAVGGTMRDFAVSRFSLALALTLEAGTSIRQALKISLEATNNAAFAAKADRVKKMIGQGATLHLALQEVAQFPEEFIASIDTAEESGMEPEVLRKQAEIYNENGARKLKWLTRVASGLVWLLVAGMIIFFIFSIAMQISGIYNQAFKDLGM